MMYNDILNHLPYKSSFRFVDHISSLDADGVIGEYTLREESFFYADHFPGNPVTPGVILTEIMAQIGLVTLGIFLVAQRSEGCSFPTGSALFPLLTSTEVSFHKMVLPGETVIVQSRKQYFRFGKLKCVVTMTNKAGEAIARGIFSGVIKQINLPSA
jgi:3-hydroxyacyl-[acyl-carrier-protein] dehydratase